MAYQLKTTGIAANCTMCIAVDPDTGTIKDFASSAVTADLLVGANVTTGSQAWDGNTRSYWRSGSGTTDADFVKFGTNKPVFQINGTVTNTTVVYIGEAAGAYVRVFGSGSTDYIAGQSGAAGGNTFPYSILASGGYSGNQTALTAGQKAIWGFVYRRGGTSDWYSANDTDASMATGNISSIGSPTLSWTLNYVGRRNDATGHNQDKTHAILIFNTALSTADWDSLRDDWFGTLLESAGGSGVTGTSSITLGAVTTSGAGIVVSGIVGTSAITLGSITTAGAGTVTGAGSITGSSSITLGAIGTSAAGRIGATLTVGPFKNKSGTVLASQSIAHVVVLNPSSRAVALSLASQSTDGSGNLALSSADLVPGSSYMVATWNSDGSAAGNSKITAAV